MKKLLLFVGILVATSSMGWAAACADGTLASYEGLGSTGCTIAGLTFANFGFSGSATGGAVSPTAAAVNVFACPGGGAFCSDLPPGEDGFVFQVASSTTSNETVDAGITYTVSGGIVDALALTSGGGTSGTG